MMLCSCKAFEQFLRERIHRTLTEQEVRSLRDHRKACMTCRRLELDECIRATDVLLRLTFGEPATSEEAVFLADHLRVCDRAHKDIMIAMEHGFPMKSCERLAELDTLMQRLSEDLDDEGPPLEEHEDPIMEWGALVGAHHYFCTRAHSTRVQAAAMGLTVDEWLRQNDETMWQLVHQDDENET